MNFFFSSRRRHTFFFQAEDGIRDRSPSRGLGDVYKRQPLYILVRTLPAPLSYYPATRYHGLSYMRSPSPIPTEPSPLLYNTTSPAIPPGGERPRERKRRDGTHALLGYMTRYYTYFTVRVLRYTHVKREIT